MSAWKGRRDRARDGVRRSQWNRGFYLVGGIEKDALRRIGEFDWRREKRCARRRFMHGGGFERSTDEEIFVGYRTDVKGSEFADEGTDANDRGDEYWARRNANRGHIGGYMHGD